MSRYSVEDRTDRLMRRRRGWSSRPSLIWSCTSLSIALRDVERDLFSFVGPSPKLDWDKAVRPWVVLGVGYWVIVAVAFALLNTP